MPGTGTPTDFRDHNGVVRMLARLEPDANTKLMRAQRTNIQTYRVANGLPPLIDQKDWVPKDNRELFGTKFLVNQQQSNGCVGFSAACAEMKVHYAASGDFKIFSGAFIYAQVNGNRDNGAVITDAMTALLEKGVCEKSEFDLPNIYQRNIGSSVTQSALKYRSTFDMTVGDWLEVMTAIQMDQVVQLPIQVGPNFENWDQYGACGFSNGSGNHSVHADGAILLPNKVWALTKMNSWGLWGPQNDGRCLLYQKHVDGCGTSDDAFAHASSLLPEPPETAP